jgi:hypothetical protein
VFALLEGLEENVLIKGEEGIGGWRKFRNVVLHDLYSSSNVKVMKSRRKR